MNDDKKIQEIDTKKKKKSRVVTLLLVILLNLIIVGVIVFTELRKTKGEGETSKF